MPEDKFYDLTGAVFLKCIEVMHDKGADYAHDDNKLANFERQASSMSLPPLVILRVYLQKHLDAFDAYVKTGKVESEPLEMRIVDIVNYFVLALGQAIAGGYEPSEEWLTDTLGSEKDAPLYIPSRGMAVGEDEKILPFNSTPGTSELTIERHEKGSGDEAVNVCCNPGGEDCCDGAETDDS